MSPAPHADAARALIDATAPVLALPIAGEVREAVTVQLARLLDAAALFTGFELPDDLGVAPVFNP